MGYNFFVIITGWNHCSQVSMHKLSLQLEKMFQFILNKHKLTILPMGNEWIISVGLSISSGRGNHEGKVGLSMVQAIGIFFFCLLYYFPCLPSSDFLTYFILILIGVSRMDS